MTKLTALLIVSCAISFSQSDPSPTMLDNYLNMSAQDAAQFQPMTMKQRTDWFLQGLANPIGYVDVFVSAAMDHSHQKPAEWGSGAEGFGKRLANIEGQTLVQSSVSFALGALTHEDNRYFGSGEKGIWRRTRYAILSTARARHDNGKQYLSASTIGGLAAGAFVANLWLPEGKNTAADAATSVGLSLAGDIGGNILNEFLPDMLHLGRSLLHQKDNSKATLISAHQ